MSRTRRKNRPRCPDGHACDWCGPLQARMRQVARARPPQEPFGWDEEDLSVSAQELRYCRLENDYYDA